MTNFYVNYGPVIPEQKVGGRTIKNLPELTPSSNGVERYEILRAHYDEGSTLEGMVKLMRRVQFSKCYETDNVPVWYSDFLNPGSGLSIENAPEDFQETIQAYDKAYKAQDRNYGHGNFWISWSTSVYDIQNQTLRLFVQEDYDHPHDFSLKDGNLFKF